jgi:hypothetical protein
MLGKYFKIGHNHILSNCSITLILECHKKAKINIADKYARIKPRNRNNEDSARKNIQGNS